MQHQNRSSHTLEAEKESTVTWFSNETKFSILSLNDIDHSNEWLVGVMEEDEPMFENDDLIWDVVQEASGAGEPIVNTRQQAFARNESSASASRLLLPIEEEEFDDDNTDEEEEDIGGYNYDDHVESDEEMFDDHDVDD